MKNEINIDELKEIYLISNTASFLFDGFADDESIRQISHNHTTDELIHSFMDLASSEIDQLDDLVFAYSLYVAIILKDDNQSYAFLKGVGAIDFEWFVELRSIYFARFKPIDTFVFESEINQIKMPMIRFESLEDINSQIIELA